MTNRATVVEQSLAKLESLQNGNRSSGANRNLTEFDTCPCCGRKRDIQGTMEWDNITGDAVCDTFHACAQCLEGCLCEGRPHIDVDLTE